METRYQFGKGGLVDYSTVVFVLNKREKKQVWQYDLIIFTDI